MGGGGGGGGSRGSVCFVETQNIHTHINLESLHRNYYTNDAETHCSKINRHYLLYSAPRKRLPGFLQTLHSVKEMHFVKAISQQVHVLCKGTGKVQRTGYIGN